MLVILLLMVMPSDDALIAKLGDNSFVVRERASDELEERMNFPLYVRLRDAHYNDLEIQLRVRRAVYRYEASVVSKYSVNFGSAKVYPLIDHVIPGGYKLDYGLWRGWSSWDFIQKYLDYADRLGAVHDGSPKWSNYRLATELFIRDRIDYCGYPAMRKAKTEKEFRVAMEQGMKPIQKDFDMFVDREVAFYNGSGDSMSYFFGFSASVSDFFRP